MEQQLHKLSNARKAAVSCLVDAVDAYATIQGLTWEKCCVSLSKLSPKQKFKATSKKSMTALQLIKILTVSCIAAFEIG